jgi:hypothetical protein
MTVWAWRYEANRMRLILITCLALWLLAFPCSAQKHPSGLFVEGGFGVKSIYGGGAGYTFLPGCDVSVRVLTGPYELDGQKTDFSTGSIQGRFTFLPTDPVCPFVEIGYGVSTLLGETTYNGHGFQTAAGLRWWISTFFEIDLRAVYARTWYHERGYPPGGQPSFTDERVWAMVSVGFTPGL